jgi:hypothetical protein
MYQNGEKLSQHITKNITNGKKYIKWPLNRPNVLKIHPHLILQDSPKCTQIPNFDLKVNHLVTLEPILGFLNLQLQRQRCNRLERFSK